MSMAWRITVVIQSMHKLSGCSLHQVYTLDASSGRHCQLLLHPVTHYAYLMKWVGAVSLCCCINMVLMAWHHDVQQQHFPDYPWNEVVVGKCYMLLGAARMSAPVACYCTPGRARYSWIVDTLKYPLHEYTCIFPWCAVADARRHQLSGSTRGPDSMYSSLRSEHMYTR